MPFEPSPDLPSSLPLRRRRSFKKSCRVARATTRTLPSSPPTTLPLLRRPSPSHPTRTTGKPSRSRPLPRRRASTATSWRTASRSRRSCWRRIDRWRVRWPRWDGEREVRVAGRREEGGTCRTTAGARISLQRNFRRRGVPRLDVYFAGNIAGDCTIILREIREVRKRVAKPKREDQLTRSTTAMAPPAARAEVPPTLLRYPCSPLLAFPAY